MYCNPTETQENMQTPLESKLLFRSFAEAEEAMEEEN